MSRSTIHPNRRPSKRPVRVDDGPALLASGVVATDSAIVWPMADTAFSEDGIPICFDARGTGTPALVLVHGWSCDRRYWDRQLSYFAERYQVVAIDLAGHGESGVSREAWTMPAFGGDVVAVAEQLRLGQMVLIGHSMGGDVIVEAALRLSDRIAGLVWVDTYRTLGEPRSQKDVERFLAPFRTDFVAGARSLVRSMFLTISDSQLVEWVVGNMSAAPPKIALDALEHAITFEPAVVAGLREISACPCDQPGLQDKRYRSPEPPRREGRADVRSRTLPHDGGSPHLQSPPRRDSRGVHRIMTCRL